MDEVGSHVVTRGKNEESSFFYSEKRFFFCFVLTVFVAWSVLSFDAWNNNENVLFLFLILKTKQKTFSGHAFEKTPLSFLRILLSSDFVIGEDRD